MICHCSSAKTRACHALKSLHARVTFNEPFPLPVSRQVLIDMFLPLYLFSDRKVEDVGWLRLTGGSYAMGFYDGSGHEEVFRSTVLAATIISSFFSILLMILLYLMRERSTGFTTIILAMTIFQTMYDMSFYYGVVPGPSTIVLVCNLFQISGGVGSSLFSNILASIVYYVLVYRKTVDVMKLFPWLCLIVFIPVAVNCIVYIVAYAEDSTHLYIIANLEIYYYIRLISIVLNFFLYSLTYIAARRIVGNMNARNEILDNAIITMVSRLKYYPLIQALARSGLTVYEMQYGYDFDPNPISSERFQLQIYSALIAPSASVGYFFVFLYMQPHAYNYFIALLKCSTYTPTKKQTKGSMNSECATHSTMHYSSHSSKKEVTFDSSQRESFDIKSFDNKSSLQVGDSRVLSRESFVNDALSRISRTLREAIAVDQREDEELLDIIATSHKA